MEKIIATIKEKWQMVILVTLMVTAVVFSATAFITPKYSSEISLIIIQKQASYKVDAFSAAKSAEYLGDILTKVVYTNTFMIDALSAPYEVKKQFSENPEKRKKQWEQALKVEKENNTGIIHVTVLDQSREEAEKLAQSVAWSFSVRGQKYHGGGDRVKVELIDGPITSGQPSHPDILLNTLLAFIVGLIGSIVLAFYFEDFNLKLFRREIKTEEKKNNWLGDKIRKQFEKISAKAVMAEEEYKIEKKEEIKPETENIIAEEEPMVYEEIEDNGVSMTGKSAAPENLPIFLEEQPIETEELPEEKKEGEFINIAELMEKNVDNQPAKSDNSEPSETEVKERLNKLLKGDL